MYNCGHINVSGKEVRVCFSDPGLNSKNATTATDMNDVKVIYTRSEVGKPWFEDVDEYGDDDDFDGGRRRRQSRKRQGGSWTKRRRATKSHGATKKSGGSRKKRRGSRKRS